LLTAFITAFPLTFVQRGSLVTTLRTGVGVHKLWQFARHYPSFASTIGVAAVGLILMLSGAGLASQIVISAFSLLIAGIESVGMVKAILRKHYGIDILAVTAIVATVIVGEYWASIIIVLMFTGGEALEDFAERRAKRELTSLLERSPLIAHRQHGDTTVDIAISEVAIGDMLLVKPGEVVPVDGKLVTADATLDESSLTGESLPVDRIAGDDLISGSVNGASAIWMIVSHRAEDSQYQRIVALVAEAAESKAPFVRMADRYAVPFTIVAYILAAVGWAISGEASRFAEVLVVATPCPLIIAAPVAFIAGMSRAARHGIIVKNAGTLERLARVKTVAFDKTGTLTHGQPNLVAIRPAEGFGEEELLRLAATAEQSSAHTLAQSIVLAAKFRGIPLARCESVVETTAHGLTAVIEGRTVVVGKFGFISDAAPNAERTKLDAGELAVYVSIDGTYAGALILRDEIRLDAAETILWLERLGVQHTLMLTGDSAATAAHVASSLGVENVQADCLPLDKVHAVQAVTSRPVMMVGDGVNDAPVLAVADIGVAMGARGSTAASESADVVIMKDDLQRVGRAVQVGVETIRIATQSIWIGMVLSLGLMVIAVFGVVPAILGAGFQEIIDLLTILNALRALGGKANVARFVTKNPLDRPSALDGSLTS
jgi:heavy metal translocating P-type ATPase